MYCMFLEERRFYYAYLSCCLHRMDLNLHNMLNHWGFSIKQQITPVPMPYLKGIPRNGKDGQNVLGKVSSFLLSLGCVNKSVLHCILNISAVTFLLSFSYRVAKDDCHTGDRQAVSLCK